MTQETAPQGEKRKYDNSTRTKRAEETRKKIVDAFAAQLINTNTPDFSIDEAAAQAGVTVRTVFRHFPNKDSMLQAVAEQVYEKTGQVSLPTNPQEFRQALKDSYAMFDENAALMKALLLSELGRGVRLRLRQRRLVGNAAALDEAVTHLDAQNQKAVKALLGHLISAETWWQLRSAFDLPGNDAAHILDWTTSLVLDALEQGKVPEKHKP